MVLSLPVDWVYDQTKPWFYHLNSAIVQMYSSFTTYIDNTITGYHSKKSCQDTSRKVTAGVNYSGHQDASQKRRAPSKRPGAWAGEMLFLDEAFGVYLKC